MDTKESHVEADSTRDATSDPFRSQRLRLVPRYGEADLESSATSHQVQLSTPGADRTYLGRITQGEPGERFFTISFTAEAYQQLQEMARRRGKTVAETVHAALGLDLWWEHQLDAGLSIQLKRADGATKTIARPEK